MIKLVEIKKVFNAGKPNEFAALRGISLTIEDGRATVIKGPSGSGKTTLLSLIGCMTRPTEGRIWLGDREITSLPERFLTEIRRKTFGFIFQQPNLIKGLTALDNILLPALPLGEPYADIRKRGMNLLERLRIGPKASSKVEWLSGGEAQRVTVARALINDPSCIIADEPTAHLDSALTQELLDILQELKRDGKTLLISSHDPLVYDSQAADRVVNVRDGRVEN
ncbi:MAG: ABC transporter ATP-binding protein [Deltaproteobacteria bacterium]|nr:ABC transporter ATP-binding protein [Deltaproteobacteria bacterium]